MKNLLLITALAISIVSCKKEDKPTSKQEGKIYFRWVEDLSNTVCPTLAAVGYKDSNSAVPDNASKSTYYGPCKAGTYQAQYNFVDFSVPNDPLIRSFTYTLTNPEVGFNRYYTKRLCGYHPPYNRCLDFSLENNLVYTDEKQ